MNFSYLSSPIESYLVKKTAIETIASALDYGHLSTLIGAGISKSAYDSFPSWKKLVSEICNKSNIPFDGTNDTNEYLLKRVEKVRIAKPDKYIDYVKEALYEDVVYDNQILKKDLLIALGSLLMISVSRNSREFVNFNFDDLFEWYLEYYGNDVQIVSEPNTLLGDSKSIVYHPHGFLPKENKFSRFETKSILFSQGDYDTAMRLHGPWSTILQRIFSSKLILMVGMSGQDSHVRNTCNFVYKEILGKSRPLGFLILPDTDDSKEDEDLNLQNGLVNLYLNIADIPETILDICRRAQNIN